MSEKSIAQPERLKRFPITDGRGHRNRATPAVARELAAYLLAVDKSGKPVELPTEGQEAAGNEAYTHALNSPAGSVLIPPIRPSFWFRYQNRP